MMTVRTARMTGGITLGFTLCQALYCTLRMRDLTWPSPQTDTLYTEEETEDQRSESESLLYLTLCDPMDYIVHGILQARILEWVAFSFSRGSSQPKDWTQVSRIAGGFFISWATREAQLILYSLVKYRAKPVKSLNYDSSPSHMCTQ